MPSSAVTSADLRTALRGIRPDRNLAFALVLDSLHCFRAQGVSSKVLAEILTEEGGSLGDQKLEGILDAVAEYQFVHPVHHDVLDTFLDLVERQITEESGREGSRWVIKAMRLLGSAYSRKRLKHLVDIGVGPYGVARPYQEEYLRTVQTYAAAGITLDPEYPLFAAEQRRRAMRRLQGVGEWVAREGSGSLEGLRDALAVPDGTARVTEATVPGGVPRPLDAAIALSGGGFRACVFHIGLLSELSGFLESKGDRLILRKMIGVSGGAIAGAYYCEGNRLDEFASRLRQTSLRAPGILLATVLLLPYYRNRLRVLSAFLDRLLFIGDKRTFGDFRNTPALGILTYDIAQGRGLTLSKDALSEHPSYRVSDAVAASCAYPPLINPLRLERVAPVPSEIPAPTAHDNAIGAASVTLYDGGLVDNRGLLALWDGGGTYDIVVSSNCGTPVYADAEQTSRRIVGQFRRILVTSLGRVSSLAADRYMRTLGDHFIEIKAPDEVRNMNTFHVPSEAEVQQLLDSGRRMGVELNARLNRLLDG